MHTRALAVGWMTQQVCRDHKLAHKLAVGGLTNWLSAVLSVKAQTKYETRKKCVIPIYRVFFLKGTDSSRLAFELCVMKINKNFRDYRTQAQIL